MSDSSEVLRDTGAAIEFYDQRFRQGYMEDWSTEKRDRVFRLIKELPLPPRGRALDFGCGTGMFSEVLAKALPGWVIEGTDLSSVAVETAASRLPQCRFFQFADCSSRQGEFDLIFTHHVLEHVSDLGETAALLSRISKPTASMFHILPCGNQGSFDHQVCLLRVDGIRAEPERLFFFEEEGHLRRLDTESIVASWENYGYQLERDWYAAQVMGAINAHIAYGLKEIQFFADPAMAVDKRSQRTLRRLRWGLALLWALRKPISVLQNKRKHGCHSLRDYALLFGSVAAFPIAKSVDWTTKYLAEREWKKRRNDRAGSEMFIYLARSS